MNSILRHAEFYPGYLTDDRSLVSVAGVLLTTIAVSLLLYLVGLFDPAPKGAALTSAQGAVGELTSRETAAGR